MESRRGLGAGRPPRGTARVSEKPRRASRWTPGRRRTTAVLSFALAALALAHYDHDVRLRRPAEEFVRRFTVGRRFPLDVAALTLEPSGDLACAMAVDAALRDESDSSSSSASPSRYRRQELSDASLLMARALAVRPGWAVHEYLLGEAAARLLPAAAASAADTARWAEPLRQASLAAPGMDAIAVARASAYLERWSTLDDQLRATASGVLRRAFLDPDFVTARLASAIQILGTRPALQLLPETEAPLKAAIKPLSRTGDVPAVAALYDRLVHAENAELADYVRKVEGRERLGDVAGRKSACWNWLSRHSVYDFDDRDGRAKLARLLDLCTRDAGATWNADPRSELVSYFLNGREREVRGDTLARSLDAFAGVPASIRARGRILAGDAAGALELADQAAGDAFEWTPVFVDLARLELSRGNAAKARAALERVPFASRDACDVLLARRDVARALADPRELDLVHQLLDRAAPGNARDAWSPGGTLALCLDPTKSAGRVLIAAAQGDADTVVSYGWDGGRLGVLLIEPGQESLRIPVTNLAGARNLSIRTLAGGPIRLGRVGLQPAS
jgi:hypothetical protein